MEAAKIKQAPLSIGHSLLRRRMRASISLYVLLVPGLLYLFLFKYVPMYGLVISFQDYNIFKGVTGSEWVGLRHFRMLFQSAEFWQVFRNTMFISVYKLVFLFPIPVLVAVLLNEIRHLKFKKTVQTIIYLPHFLSWVIISSIFVVILSPSEGIVNQIIAALGGKPVPFMVSNEWFRSILVTTQGWKEIGWSAIIYIAAITGIDQDIYEAARIDGAGRIKQMLHITLPGIAPTIVLLLILRIGHILSAGTEQILLMYNPSVYESSDVIGTFIYRMGIGKMDYSFSTAVGLFESVVGFLLIMLGNGLSRKLMNRSIW
ncbi:MAG: protein lplB [Paenibacillaceae bacterium]|nr:protein lplB [Paenibacillaceae bacterium]